jgi:hypothetical protein
MNVIAAAQAHNRKAVQQKWLQFCDPTLAFSDPSFNRLVDIWRAKAGERPMPTRSEMTARDMKDYLRNIFIIQRDGENHSSYRWRLVGTRIAEILGNHTGKTFEESIPAEHLDRWIETSDLILDTQKPWRFRGRVRLQGRDFLDAENLFLPLANDNNEPSFVLGLCRYTSHVSDDRNGWENEMASMPGGLL